MKHAAHPAFERGVHQLMLRHARLAAELLRYDLRAPVIVVAGKGDDPMNDNDVDVGIYMSGDKLVKDGNGEIARDYTFRIKPDAKFEALFKASSSNGVITSKGPADEVWLRDPSYTRELQLLRARISLKMAADGSLTGYVGGYTIQKPKSMIFFSPEALAGEGIR